MAGTPLEWQMADLFSNQLIADITSADLRIPRHYCMMEI